MARGMYVAQMKPVWKNLYPVLVCQTSGMSDK